MPVRMNQGKTDEEYQPHAPVPSLHKPVPVYQQTSHKQYYGFVQGGPVKFLSEGTQNLAPMAMTSTQTLQLPLSGTLQYYGETLNCTQHCCMPPLPVGFSQGGSVRFLPNSTQNLPSLAMTSAQAAQPPPGTPEYNVKTFDGPQKNGPAGDLTACQLRNPSSNLPQGVTGACAHSSHKPVVDALQKRELRLMKNREAARECRRKKKEYVKCLENRVAVLENQNKTLIEELRSIKDIYRHKVE